MFSFFVALRARAHDARPNCSACVVEAYVMQVAKFELLRNAPQAPQFAKRKLLRNAGKQVRTGRAKRVRTFSELSRSLRACAHDARTNCSA